MQYRRLAKRAYHKDLYLWINEDDDFTQLKLELSSDGKLPRGRLREISASTGINYKTLESWRRRWRTDPDWTPQYGRPEGPHVLSADTETAAEARLEDTYIQEHRLCPRAAVTRVLSEEGKKTLGPEFQAGRTLVENFLKRWNLSMRKPHLRRRTAPDDHAIGRFLLEMNLAQMQFPPSLILNVDETCWRLINGQVRTLARTGQEDVHVMTRLTEKSDITAIACVTLSGERLPLWIIAKGTTPVCEEKFRTAPNLRRAIGRHLFVDHSESGWSTGEVMIRYLSWLKERNGGRLIYVLWDLHASHRDERVKEWAKNEEIGLLYIPAGQTNEWQPLDRRVFGSLKSRAMKLLNEKMIESSLDNCNMCDAVEILLKAWEEIDEDEVRNAWEPLVVAPDE